MSRPRIGSFQSESALESFNRVYCMLKCLQYAQSSKHSSASFSGDVWREPRMDASLEWSTTVVRDVGDLKALGATFQKNWTIVWKKGSSFSEKRELDDQFKAVSASLSNCKTTLDVDLRLCADSLQWRDSTKGQYQWLQLNMSEHSIHLTHSFQRKSRRLVHICFSRNDLARIQ